MLSEVAFGVFMFADILLERQPKLAVYLFWPQ